MKKVIMFAIVVIALSLSSCGKSVQNAGVATDSTTTVVDSLSSDSIPNIDTVTVK